MGVEITFRSENIDPCFTVRSEHVTFALYNLQKITLLPRYSSKGSKGIVLEVTRQYSVGDVYILIVLYIALRLGSSRLSVLFSVAVKFVVLTVVEYCFIGLDRDG